MTSESSCSCSLPSSVLISSTTPPLLSSSDMAPASGCRCRRRSSGVHQYEGNVRWMLLMRRATANMMPQLSMTTGTKNQPRRRIWSSTTASSAVAPAGGCTVLVKAMTAVTVAHDTAPPTQRIEAKYALSWKSLQMPMPNTAARIWPMKKLRGCARGDSMA
ncbi:hypothetical protein AUP68_09746 [Ilyonectria robusta]